MSRNNDLQAANLDLLLQVNRLLDEADRARVLRDRLLSMVRPSTQSQVATAIRNATPRKGGTIEKL
jgi:hypothetical protein